MTPLPLVIVVNATMLLAAAAVVDARLQRRGSAAARHLVWTIAIAGLLALPIASLSLPAWTLRIPIARPVAPAPVATRGIMTASRTTPQQAVPSLCGEGGLKACATNDAADDAPSVRGRSLFAALVVLYVAGVLLLLARLIIEPIALRRLARGARELTDPEWSGALDSATLELRVGQPVRLLHSAGEIMPPTFCTLAPALVLPASAPAGRRIGARRAAAELRTCAPRCLVSG